MSERISVAQLTTIAGVKPRALKKALLLIASGERRTWRGAALDIRQVHGRGGRSGWSYEVRVDSLPADLQAIWKGLQSPVQLPLKLDDAEASARNMRFHIIGPVLKTEPGTPERAAATKARAAETFQLDGKVFPASERSIQRWVEKHEAEGFAGLHRKKRKGAGERAATVSRAWDAAVKLPEGTGRAIAAELEGYIGGLVKAGESPSIIPHHAQLRLFELAARGATLVVALGPESLLEVVVGARQARYGVAVEQAGAVAARNLDEMRDGGFERTGERAMAPESRGQPVEASSHRAGALGGRVLQDVDRPMNPGVGLLDVGPHGFRPLQPAPDQPAQARERRTEPLFTARRSRLSEMASRRPLRITSVKVVENCWVFAVGS